MAVAMQLARRGWNTTPPNPRVGCVLVRDEQIIGRGWHVRTGEPHAEINALQDCKTDPAGSTCYVTLEPCAHTGRTGPCYQALIDAGISRVVVAMQDPNPKVSGKGLALLNAAGIQTEAGIMQQQAEALNPGFCKRMRTGLPWLRSKLAMSVDGRTALASGESRWITSAQARADVHRWRAASAAIVTGIGTVLADDPRLTARPGDILAERQPLRVIMDRQLRLPLTASMLQQPGRTVVFTRQTTGTDALVNTGVEIEYITATESSAQLREVMQQLATRWEINDVLVEAGAELNGQLLAANMIDELIIYMAPTMLGDKARGLLQLPLLENMQQRPEFEITDMRRLGPDIRLTLRPVAA